MKKVLSLSNGDRLYFEEHSSGAECAAARIWSTVGVWVETEQDDLYYLEADPSQTRLIPAALINPSTYAAASVLGRKGGQAKSERKTAAVRENGKKGGRPPYTLRSIK